MLTKFTTNFKNVTLVKCGAYHTIVIDNFTNVYTGGQNNHGQLGKNGPDQALSKVEGLQVIGKIVQVYATEGTTVLATGM